MPVTIKTSEMSYKDNLGNYHGINAIAEKKISDQIDDLDAAISAQESRMASDITAMESAADGIEAQKNTMIASIASVAGQGTDTTLTQSGVAADAKAAGDGISELKSAVINSISMPVNVPLYFEQGNINASTGANTSTNASIRLRTSYSYLTEYGFSFNVPDGFQAYLYFYNGDTFLRSGGAWFTGTVSYGMADYDSIRIVIRNDENTTIVPSDLTSDIILTAYRPPFIKSSFDGLKNSIENNFQQITGSNGLAFLSGRYASQTSSGINETVSYNMSSDYVCAICPCVKGDTFNVHIYGAAGTARGYFVCDSSMKCLSRLGANTEVNGTVTISDDNAAYIVFNNALSRLSSGYFAYKGESIINKYYDLFAHPDACYITKGKTTAIEGITIVPINDHQVKIYGTSSSSSVRFINFLNGAWGFVPSSSDISKRIPKGKYTLQYTFTSTGDMTDVSFRTVTTSIDDSGAPSVNNNETFTRDVPFILLMRVVGNKSFGTEEDPTILDLHLYGDILKDARELLPTNDTTDRTAEIKSILYAYNKCQLTAGRYYVSGIIMGDDCELSGYGSETEIILLDSVESGSAIRLGANCIVSNLSVVGGMSAPEFTDLGIDTISIGTRHGILWLGEGDENTKTGSMISDVFIRNFNGGGITCDNTGYGTNAGMTVNNVQIESCGAGINIAYWSEFNRFTNVKVWHCFYGCICNGGNNSFVNCGFSSNNTGFYINEATDKAVRYDGTIKTARNGSHGQMIGCIINHTGMADFAGSNNGYSIYDVGSDSGFVFDGLQIFYGKIYCKNASMIMLSNSRLTGVEIIVYGNSGTFIANMCYMMTSGNGPVTAIVLDKNTDQPYTNFDETGNTPRSKVLNCYNYSGSLISLQSLVSQE